MAAHDLRHPVSAIMFYAELLLEGASLPEDQRSIIRSIHEASGFMVKMLDDMSDIASIESGQLHLYLEEVDPADLLAESIALCRSFALRKQTQVSWGSNASGTTLLVDSQKMTQVLVNLIHNAIKYSQAGAHIQVRAALDGDGVVISVDDDGPGIPSDELSGLFTPFQRTRARAASAEHGTGLGLAIAERIVQKHGGQIWAESVFGLGSVFFVRLPVTTGLSGLEKRN